MPNPEAANPIRIRNSIEVIGGIAGYGTRREIGPIRWRRMLAHVYLS